MTKDRQGPTDENGRPPREKEFWGLETAIVWSTSPPPPRFDGQLRSALHVVDELVPRPYHLWGWIAVEDGSPVQGVCLPGLLVINRTWFLSPALFDRIESLSARWNHEGNLELTGDGLWLGTGRPLEELDVVALDWWIGEAMDRFAGRMEVEDVGPGDDPPWEELCVLEAGAPWCADCGGPVERPDEVCETCWIRLEVDLAIATWGPLPDSGRKEPR